MKKKPSFLQRLRKKPLSQNQEQPSDASMSLERDRRELETLGMLAASIEHDVRNPLEVMSFEIERLRERYQHDKDIQRIVQRIEQQRRRIFTTVQISRLMRGREYFETFQDKFDVRELIDLSVSAVKREIRSENIFFKQESREGFYIKGTLFLLEQAIVNILKNPVEAINESGRGTGVIEISFKVAPRSTDFLLIEIADNGCGLSDEDITVLSLGFTTKRHLKPHGGVGLFITQRIVFLHGGEMEIRNNSPKGAVVSLVLPRFRQQKR